MSEFMNALLRSHGREDSTQEPVEEPESIGGKSDAGAGDERMDTAGTDMNALLREAVFDSRSPRV